MKWKTLQHNGILLPPEYEPHNIRFKIKGKDVKLNLLQEEMVYQWAKKKDTPYVKDATFRNNFTADFGDTFSPKRKLQYNQLDFTHAYQIIDAEKEAKLALTKEDRKALAARRKKIREELKAKYGTAIIDGQEADLANYMVEPPGIFIGRGKHPLRGRWKPRVHTSSITLNLGEDAPVPPGEWSAVHNHDSVWVAKWTDKLTKKTKYVLLDTTTSLRQDMDKVKYEKAAILASKIEQVRNSIIRDMAGNGKHNIIATVCYLIYRTAMRVGDEKDEEEADTVGATTLRKEHVEIKEDAIMLDFLGKDSVRWQEEIKLSDGEDRFRQNLENLLVSKNEGDQVFSDVKSQDVNRYLSGIVKGVTAKVFRTYLATKVVTEYLRMNDDVKSSSPSMKIYHAKTANLRAAIRCNHKRAIPKTFKESLKKKKDNLKRIKSTSTWSNAEETLRKVRASTPKTPKQKAQRLRRMRKLREQIKRRKQKHQERVEKLSLQIKLTENTKDYNLGTSLRNYIDPRILKAWTGEVEAEWEKMYTAALQKKFLWIKKENQSWDEIKKSY